MTVGGEAAPLTGGCACGELRYRLLAPLFVHCCHCTRCQRETGAPFAHHALIEASHFEWSGVAPQYVAVPSDSGSRNRVARCSQCQTALWNAWGRAAPVTLYVRVGTLDEPARCPPQAHIFTRSTQPWLAAPPGAPVFRSWYDPEKLWPRESLERHAAAACAAKPARRPD